uniref:SCP domain-containing protein n=2 Tax=Mesocestoides corti TaxID=53468 RepID=A0A5K3FWJ2_MESCO
IIGNLNDTYKNQKDLYNYDTNTCTFSCYYFKTMVWSQTTAVGCTIEDCQNSGILRTACIYKPGKFDPPDRPYEKGQSCTKCPTGSACYRNQCENSLITVPTNSSATNTSTLQILPSLFLIL